MNAIERECQLHLWHKAYLKAGMLLFLHYSKGKVKLFDAIFEHESYLLNEVHSK
jgi:hypothetical protein